MSKSHRIATVALGIALLALPSLAQQPQKTPAQSQPNAPGDQGETAPASDGDAAPEQGYAERFLAAVERIEPAIRQLIAEQDEAAAKEQRERDNADLHAQESMAKWALWMFVTSLLSVVLTAVGVVLIWRTLIHTRDAAKHAGSAVDEAKRATTAAQDAVEVTRQIGEAQVRAYLSCRGARYILGKERISALVELGNTGQSPAGNITLSGYATIQHIGGNPRMSRVLSDIPSTETSVSYPPIISAGTRIEEITFWDQDFWRDDVDGDISAEDREMREHTFSNGNYVFFDLAVKWTDVFDKTHSFGLELEAEIDATPGNLNRKRSTTGKLRSRMLDVERTAAQNDDSENPN